MTDIFEEIEKGEIKGLWLIATNPVASMPDTHRIRKILSRLEFLVVQDVFYPLESADFAHVFLPGAMWAEKTGTFTNSERRVNLVRKAVNPPGEARSDLEIFIAVGEKLGMGKLLSNRLPETVFEEIRAISRGRLCDYSGIDYPLLESEKGIQWPATPDTTGGSARLYTDGRFSFEDGKARLIPLAFVDNNETPDEEYPFWFNTGRVIEHWHTRTKTGRIGNLNKFSPLPYLEMNPRDGRRLGVATMEHARVSSRRGSIEVLVQLTERSAPGQVFLPFHFSNGANLLTLGLLDPHSRQPAYKQCAVKIEKAVGEDE
jgi:predicted molibdopterin-dependent oxidoreductase YjgC